MNKNTKQESESNLWEVANHANRHLLREITKEKLSQSSISSYGAAGLSFVAILALVQMDSLRLTQQVAFASFAFAIPILLFLAVLHENFIWYGEVSFGEYKKMSRTKGFYYFLVGGYCLFGLGFFFLLWSISWAVAIVTAMMTIALLFTNTYVTNRISEVLDKRLGATEGEGQSN